VDPVAVKIARTNFQRANIPALLFTGSAAALRSGGVDLIVSNINASASIELAPQFARCLTPGGRLLVSGFEEPEALAVEAALERAGGAVERRLMKGTWRAIVASIR